MLINKKGNQLSGFFRRFKFYGFGLLLGILLVNFFFKDRAGCAMPATVKLGELKGQELLLTRHGKCRMECRKISTEDIEQVFNEGKINYNKSKVHDSPCPTYAIELHEEGKDLRIIIADCDTLSKLVTAIDLNLKKDYCECD